MAWPKGEQTATTIEIFIGVKKHYLVFNGIMFNIYDKPTMLGNETLEHVFEKIAETQEPVGRCPGINSKMVSNLVTI